MLNFWGLEVISIKDVTKQTGISVRTMRYYDEIGLTSATCYRYYFKTFIINIYYVVVNPINLSAN